MNTPQVESYRFGQMVVDGERYTKDLILLPDRVIPNWWREQGHRLSVKDLEEVFAAQSEVLVVGTGAHGVMKVPPETRQATREAGVELRIADTDRAWRLYNELREKRRTAGAFHLTC
ncbi:MAG: Mth938-like domain-containing protein [Anaerolineae bacterium]|jgi:hypothetical protein